MDGGFQRRARGVVGGSSARGNRENADVIAVGFLVRRLMDTFDTDRWSVGPRPNEGRGDLTLRCLAQYSVD
jgi:hypothetical protein